MEEGNAVTIMQHLHYQRIRTPVRPGLPMEGQTAAGQGQVRGWLLHPETRRFGRRSRPLTTPEALTPTRARGRGRELAMLPASMRGTRSGGVHQWRGGGGRASSPSPQGPRHSQVGRNEGGALDLLDNLPKNTLIKEGTLRPMSHGVSLSLSLRGTGIEACAKRLSRRFERRNAAPTVEERACWERVAEAEDRAALKRVGSIG